MPIPNSNKYIITFEDNGKVYKMILERKQRRPKNLILSEALDTPDGVLQTWQGPYYDFFGHNPTPKEMGLQEVHAIHQNGTYLYFNTNDVIKIDD